MIGQLTWASPLQGRGSCGWPRPQRWNHHRGYGGGIQYQFLHQWLCKKIRGDIFCYCLLIYLFIYLLFNYLSIFNKFYSLTYSFIHSFIHSFTYMYLCTYLFIHYLLLFTYMFINSFIIHSFIYFSFIHLFICIYLFTQSVRQTVIVLSTTKTCLDLFILIKCIFTQKLFLVYVKERYFSSPFHQHSEKKGQ